MLESICFTQYGCPRQVTKNGRWCRRIFIVLGYGHGLTARGLPCPFPPSALTSLHRLPFSLRPSAFCCPGCLQRSWRVSGCAPPLPGYLPRARHTAPLTCDADPFLALLLPHLKTGGYGVPPTPLPLQGFLLSFFSELSLCLFKSRCGF